MITHYSYFLLGLAMALPVRLYALSNVTQATMAEVVKIARAIRVVNPRLSEPRSIEFGLGIFRASRRYDIEPSVLVAITQQETGFRPNLPEGKAGEIGICQIRKMWLRNDKFRAEFPDATIDDMKVPAKNFLMAAWILSDLKGKSFSRTLPYWSFYNAVKFENRFKYFLLVNRNLAALRKQASFLFPAKPVASRSVAADDKPIYRLAAEKNRRRDLELID